MHVTYDEGKAQKEVNIPEVSPSSSSSQLKSFVVFQLLQEVLLAHYSRVCIATASSNYLKGTHTDSIYSEYN